MPSSAETIFTGHLVKKKKTDTIYSLQFQVSQFECRKADLQQQQKKMQTESIYVQRRERVGELIWHRRPVTSIKENPAVDGHVQNDQQADADGFYSPPPLERPYAIVVVFAEHSTAL